MNNLSKIKKAFVKLSTRKDIEIPAFLGDLSGTVIADANSNVYVVLFNGQVMTVRNVRVPNVSRLPVVIGYEGNNPNLLQVLRARDAFDAPSHVDLPAHAEKNHAWPNVDTLWVRGEQILPGLAIPSALTVQLVGFVYYLSGFHLLDNQTIDLSAQVPATGAKYILVEVDTSGVISFNVGSAVASREVLTPADIPTPTANKMPLFAVKMYVGQTEILKSLLQSDIVDLRWARWSAGGIADAPSDSVYYGRRNGAWTNLKTYFDTLYALLLASTASNDFQVGNGSGGWIKKTLAEVKTILGLGSAAYTASTDYQPIDSDLTAISALTPANDDVIQRKAGAWVNRTIAQLVTDIRAVTDTLYSALAHTHAYNEFNARLTLETGVAISTTNQTAKTTLYLTPYRGNKIALYNGVKWMLYEINADVSLSLSGFTANKNSDIWIYDNGGTLTLERTEWTSNTARATALTLQDGVYVKSGATTRRYVGTIRTTATTGQCEDSLQNRFVWNYYNRIRRPSQIRDTTGWTYATAVWRQSRGSTTNQINFVVGIVEDTFHCIGVFDCLAGSGGWIACSWGLNITDNYTGRYFLSFSTLRGGTFADGVAMPTLGYNYIASVEIASGVTATINMLNLDVMLKN
jgi:hypothetical protein